MDEVGMYTFRTCCTISGLTSSSIPRTILQLQMYDHDDDNNDTVEVEGKDKKDLENKKDDTVGGN
ncbi:hypothetical protein JR316_0012097 [Psilocybe cubensis]|uniref:Uncharacterized protein n=1 Tax=Psilocybe cubensis TaxID=181762 RepID=A0ACB8GHA2_PSICU|nr:hypothetical protein JR316_0012097 [Psilocybe cubensis]KAH9474998.1 hypothetical protein JR316_0012097 [Psilocybe cubensis]